MRLRFDYLRGLGCLTTMAAVQKGDIASLRAVERAGPFTRRAALHVKLAGINYIRYDGSTMDVLMKSRRSKDVAGIGNEEARICADD
jgi:hypothetical protein